MTTFHPRSSLKDVLAQPDARAVVERIAPAVLVHPLATSDDPFPLALVLGLILEPTDPRIAELVAGRANLDCQTNVPHPC